MGFSIFGRGGSGGEDYDRRPLDSNTPSRFLSLAILLVFWYLCVPEKGPQWPKGSYGLPRPVLGCPLSNAPVWKTGWRFQDTEDSNPDNRQSESFHMDAVVMKNDMNKSFCIATQAKGPGWPKGEFTFVGHSC